MRGNRRHSELTDLEYAEAVEHGNQFTASSLSLMVFELSRDAERMQNLLKRTLKHLEHAYGCEYNYDARQDCSCGLFLLEHHIIKEIDWKMENQ